MNYSVDPLDYKIKEGKVCLFVCLFVLGRGSCYPPLLLKKIEMKKIKVRFNLGKGEHYMKWKVTFPSGSIVYVNPQEQQLIMSGCELKNNPKIAKKIFDGETKSVCAWISCEAIEINAPNDILYNKKLKFNPKINPCWTFSGRKDSLDGTKFDTITSYNTNLYV